MEVAHTERTEGSCGLLLLWLLAKEAGTGRALLLLLLLILGLTEGARTTKCTRCTCIACNCTFSVWKRDCYKHTHRKR